MTEGRTLPVDRLLGIYLLVAGAALLFPHRPPPWWALLGAHIVIAALLLSGVVGRAREGATRIGRLLAAWYPLLLMPFLYWELPQLIGSVWDDRFFDGVVMAWEAAIFGGQPSATLASRWDTRALSETLHAAYLSYYPVIYFFPAALYLRGQRESFEDTIFALMLGFTLSYTTFILFPVQGPRFLFPAPVGAGAEGPLYALTRAILEGGSSRGAAFPSAHAAVAAVQTVNAARHLPAAVPVLALLTIGICVGAVYGGFHYAVDVVAGVLLGLVVAAVAPRLRGALR